MLRATNSLCEGALVRIVPIDGERIATKKRSRELKNLMTNVVITTGARLHFGPLSVAAPAGGRFGGVGVMIESPRVVVSARTAEIDSVQADEQTATRVANFLRHIRQALPVGNGSGCELTVTQTIPSHCGFGSGTQLGLAVALAASVVDNEPKPGLETLARRVGRGLRSAVGLHGFAQGGFLVDGGRAETHQLGTLVSRVDFPSDWRFVLAVPQQTVGLSGEAEQSAFASQPPMSQQLTAELCRIVLMDWLPSVIEADFARCAESLFTFGHAVGQFFSPAQGGVFAHPRMAEWAALIRQRGIQGVAQTSWGPTLAALCSSEALAHQLKQDFMTDAAWHDCSFDVVSPLNRGANVTVG